MYLTVATASMTVADVAEEMSATASIHKQQNGQNVAKTIVVITA